MFSTHGPPGATPGNFIGTKGQERLRKYKYNVIDRSIIAPYLQPFWTRFVTYLPLWIAPNAVTVSGLSLMMVDTLLCYIYSPTLSEALPTNIIWAHCVLLFLYQTLDAVDGKQARRTKSSSPLGEICDHTCDALVVTLGALACASTARIGTFCFMGPVGMVVLWAIAAFAFGVTTWETYHTGVMVLPEINGPNEGLAGLYFMHAITALFGQDRLWKFVKFEVFGCRFGGIEIAFLITGTASLYDSLPRLVHMTMRAARGELSCSAAHALATILPVPTMVVLLLGWHLASPGGEAAQQIFVFLLGAGFMFAYLMGRLILAHLTGERQGLVLALWGALTPLYVGFANAVVASRLGVALLPETVTLRLNLAFSTFLYLGLARGVAREICALLGIRAFHITPQKEQ